MLWTGASHHKAPPGLVKKNPACSPGGRAAASGRPVPATAPGPGGPLRRVAGSRVDVRFRLGTLMTPMGNAAFLRSGVRIATFPPIFPECTPVRHRIEIQILTLGPVVSVIEYTFGCATQKWDAPRIFLSFAFLLFPRAGLCAHPRATTPSSSPPPPSPSSSATRSTRRRSSTRPTPLSCCRTRRPTPTVRHGPSPSSPTTATRSPRCRGPSSARSWPTTAALRCLEGQCSNLFVLFPFQFGCALSDTSVPCTRWHFRLQKP